ncbi:MAG TPA: hypothetical protein VIL49_18650 [Capillimicrobium sp.]|jgi:hypothetical protein
MSLLRRAYGTTPLHLLGHLACFALAGYAVAQLVDTRGALNLLLWLVGALVLHDLVLLPAYSLLDRLAARGAPRGAVNYVRAPAAIAGVLALVWFPTILGKGDGAYARVSGLHFEGYLRNWLLICAALFLASALLYVVRGRRGASRGRAGDRAPAAPPPPPSP